MRTITRIDVKYIEFIDNHVDLHAVYWLLELLCNDRSKLGSTCKCNLT